MSFGQHPYGTTPWGGTAVESGGVTLVSADPAPNETGVAVGAVVTFHIYSPVDFYDLTLQVTLNGIPAIVDSTFVGPYTGVINYDYSDIQVSISHPNFADGNPVAVSISVTDLSGTVVSVNYSFNVAGAIFDAQETLTLTETLNFGFGIGLSETMTIEEGMSPFIATVTENLTMVEDSTVVYSVASSHIEALNLFESIQVGTFYPFSIDGNTVSVEFPEEMRLDGVTDPRKYRFTAPINATSINVESVIPNLVTRQTGTQGQVIAPPGATISKVFDTYTGVITPEHIGDYIFITDSDSPDQRSFSPSEAYRIEDFSGTQVLLDRPLPAADPSNGVYVPGVGFTPGTGQLSWTHTSAVKSLTIKTSEFTRNQIYKIEVKNLKRKVRLDLFSAQGTFTSTAARPKVVSAQFLAEDGTIIVKFDEGMRIDNALLDPGEYSVSGPTDVLIKEVRSLSPTTVAIHTNGFGSGSYVVTVNATGTPKDIAGNPMDPVFNNAIFSGSVPLISRSIFTDKGPIVKPELTLQSGTGGTIQTQVTQHFGNVTINEVVLPGGTFTSGHVGKYVELGGSTVNAGFFKVVSVVSPTRLKLEANLRLPDASNGALTWRLYDPRTGDIADDPSDVVVRVNGIPVVPEAVVGLLGQIVLGSAPDPTDDVKVDYNWIPDPTVEIRRLNSREFKLNGWANDSGRPTNTQHTYRYRNVLISPSTFVPEVVLAEQIQPLLRELHYRAYERAYSVSLNDPNLFLLNTPIHRIAYPPLSRQIPEESVSYAADTLPEVDPTAPWERKGIGLATVASGSLTVQDNTGGPYPTGNPLFWVRDADFTFQHVFAMTWRMRVVSSTPVGVFTGVAAGWSDDQKVALVGFLDDGGVKKIGFLRAGFGNDPSVISAWAGGISSPGPVALDWSIDHGYRILRDRDGVIRLYLDGDVVETLRILPSELPFLEELDDPFDQVQGVFFGSLSRQAANVSTWDFVRYLVLPTNPEQSVPSISVAFEGDQLPEEAPNPWTPIGYHGNASLFSGSLLVDSTSATAAVDVGLINGDFRGYTRIEPLLQVSSDVILDVAPQLRTYTHGVTPDAVMVAVDDGSRLVQVSFMPTKPQPKYSYPGRSLPQDATPKPWLPLGSEIGRMAGQTLVIEDSSTIDGLIYALEDLEPNGSDSRVLETTNDYYVEFKFKVLSYTPDGSGENFCGLTVDTFDGTRTIGLMTKQTPSGTRRLAFHSDGISLGPSAQFDFDWFDGSVHVVRIVKNTLGNLVSLFVDNALLGTSPYTSFSVTGGNPTISFGSATTISTASLSVVEWHYVNTWRGQPSSGVRKYVGIWKGFDNNLLTGYYLPTKVEGDAAVAGNALTASVNFVTLGVLVGDDLIVDYGPNKGVYSIASVSPGAVTISGTFPVGPSEVKYRIPAQTDWTASHKYRLVRDPSGAVALLLDSDATPLIRLDYNEVTLPPSSAGLPYKIHNGMPSVTWGAFDSTNLSQVAWDFVRYIVTKSLSESRIVPHHHVLNQRNVMSSPVTAAVAHGRTQFSSSSTGIPYPWEEFVNNPLVEPYTKLNEGTPLVPQTQTYEVRRPTPSVYFLSGLNRPEDILNADGDFLLNDGSTEIRLIVPKDVLYDSLQIVENSSGEPDYIAPISDEYNPIALKKLSWQKEVCGTYAGDVLPEQDPGFGTQWVLESDNPGSVVTTNFNGILTYGVGPSTGNTIYRNPTPLTDPIGLNTKVDFTLKVLNDTSSGTDDTGIRFGFSAFGTITAALAFVTTPSGDREVRLLDMATQQIVASILFDFLDGSYHTYRLVKNIDDGTVDFLIDP
jgi:hypothetical protein